MIILLLAIKDELMREGVSIAAKDFGAAVYYGSLTGSYAKAGKEEEIKIFAHGNEVEIGEKSGEPSWSPEQLTDMLYEYLITSDYKGKISIDACKSGVRDELRRSFVDKLYHHMITKHGFKGSVWGYGGNVSGFSTNEVVKAAGGELPSGWMEVKAVDRF